jgi:hypothetical protein
MSICNFDETEICFKSFDSLRKDLNKVYFDSMPKDYLFSYKITEKNTKKIINDLVKNKIWSTISKKDIDSLKQFIIEKLIPNIPFDQEKVDLGDWKDTIQNFYKLVLEIVVNSEGGFDEILPAIGKYKMFELAVLYAQNLNKRIPGIEDFLFNDNDKLEYDEGITYQNMLFYYINLFWKDKEDPELWKLLKKVRPLTILIEYDKKYLKKRLKILESLILNEEKENLFRNINVYSTDIIKGRWEEVEPFMLETYKRHLEDKDIKEKNYYENDDNISRYSIDILKRRWLEIEPLMYRKYKMRNDEMTDGLYEYLENFEMTVDDLVKDEKEIKKSTKSSSRSPSRSHRSTSRSRSRSPKRSGLK